MPNHPVTLRRWQLVGIFMLLVLSFVAAIFLVQREARMRTNDNHQLIVAQGKLLHKQIEQRAEVTFTTCLDQNDRHDKTIERLDAIIAKAVVANPADATRIRSTRASTVFIIEALAPHQNCKQLVLDRFGFVPDLKGDE